MNKILYRRLQYFGMILSLLVMSGCIGGTTQPSVYYVLNASDTDAGYSVPGLDLGVGPVTLPGILDRPQIVSRQGGTIWLSTSSIGGQMLLTLRSPWFWPKTCPRA